MLRLGTVSLLLALAVAHERCSPGEQSASLLQSLSKKRKVLLENRLVEEQQPSPLLHSSGPLLLLRQLAGRVRVREVASPPTLVFLAVLILFCSVGLGLCFLGISGCNGPTEKTPAQAVQSPWKQFGLSSNRRGLHAGRDATAAVPQLRVPNDSAVGSPMNNPMLTSTPGTPAARRLPPPESTPSQSMLSLACGGSAASLLDSQLDPPPPEGAFLCPGLVVPEDSECSLLLPRLQPTAAVHEITVDDAARVPVFRARYCLPSRDGSGSTSTRLDQDGNRCLVLCSSNDDHTVFAFCRLGFNGALTIFDTAEKPFGLIRSRVGKAGFEVATRVGAQIHVGLNRSGDLAAIDRRGRTLALTQPLPGDSLHRMLRIGPFVDAGLITLAVLAVDLLESPPVPHAR